MTVVLQCWLNPIARDEGEESKRLGYLKAFDPEAAAEPGIYPTGQAEFTKDLAEAIHFADADQAFHFWRTRSKTCPTRPDGKPNRPLTMFSIEMVKV